MFDRQVNIIEPKSEQSKPVSNFSSFINSESIVLLGDPGAGKTHLFKEFSEREQAKYFTAASFDIYADDSLSGEILYIDGLDEERSSTTDLIKNIIKKLIEIKPSKLRISCRSYDWLGDTDFILFKPLFDGMGDTSVLNLDLLHDNEVDEIVLSSYNGDLKEFKLNVSNSNISSLLLNPQTLLMLIDVVNAGVWPKSKADLYEKSALILLKEHNPKHALGGTLSISELLGTAGEISAHLLISNSIGLSTNPADHSRRINSLSEITNLNLNTANQVIKSKLFSSQASHIFSYSHRTVAEFLTARWLISKIHKNLSLTRVLESLGFDGYPSSEMKGVFAWLATLSNTHATEILHKDPFALLTYGDPSQLSPQNKVLLLDALEGLSKDEPWFYDHRKKNESLGVLANVDTKDKLISLLSDSKSSFHLKLLIINSIEFGEWHDDYLTVVLDIVKTSKYAAVLRHEALNVVVDKCKSAHSQVVNIYNIHLKSDMSSLVLRSKILVKLYQPYFNENDVVAYLNDYCEMSKSRVIGELWTFGKNLSANALPSILSLLSEQYLKLSSEELRSVNSEVTRVYSDIVERTLPNENLPIKDIYNCLYLLNKFSSPYNYKSDSYVKPLEAWIASNQNLIIELFNLGLSKLKESNWYSFWNTFESLCLYQLDKAELLTEVFSHCLSKYEGVQLKNALQMCMMLSQHIENINIYGQILEKAAVDDIWKEAIENWTYDTIEQWRLDQNQYDNDRKKEDKLRLQKTKEDFEKDLVKIEQGTHEGWLYHGACLYLGYFHDSKAHLSPQERVVNDIGYSNWLKLKSGLSHYPSRCNITKSKVITAHSNQRYNESWYTFIVSVDIKWTSSKGKCSFTNSEIEKIILLDAVCQSPQLYGDKTENWADKVIQLSPRLASEIYMELAAGELNNKKSHSTGISKIVYNELIPNSLKINGLIQLLKAYPNMYLQNLKNIFELLISEENLYPKLSSLAEELLNQRNKVRGDNRGYWLAMLFITEPTKAYKKLASFFNRKPEVIWPMISLLGRREEKAVLANPLIYFQLIELFGKKFPNSYHPRGSSSGSHNSWDAAEAIRDWVSKLSSSTSQESSQLLETLIKNNKLLTYRDHLKEALSKQRKLARNAMYKQLNWLETINLLNTGKPEKAKELLIFTMQMLLDIQRRIKFSNTDIYKTFWNEDKYSKVTTPKTEESCRDRLLDLIRIQTTSIGVNAEPEGHMSQDKRADIVLYNDKDSILPLELKCESHQKIWNAQTKQLKRLYSSDPRADGYGVYVVFWFGVKCNGNWRNPINRKELIKSPYELQEILNHLSPDEKVKGFVLDVTVV